MALVKTTGPAFQSSENVNAVSQRDKTRPDISCWVCGGAHFKRDCEVHRNDYQYQRGRYNGYQRYGGQNGRGNQPYRQDNVYRNSGNDYGHDHAYRNDDFRHDRGTYRRNYRSHRGRFGSRRGDYHNQNNYRGRNQTHVFNIEENDTSGAHNVCYDGSGMNVYAEPYVSSGQGQR